MSDENPEISDQEADEAHEDSQKSERPKRARGRARAHKTSQDSSPVAASEAGGEETSTETRQPDNLERAEKMVGEWTIQAEQIGLEIGHQVVRLFARAREEAEDIWAEAQELRRNEGTREGDSQQ